MRAIHIPVPSGTPAGRFTVDIRKYGYKCGFKKIKITSSLSNTAATYIPSSVIDDNDDFLCITSGNLYEYEFPIIDGKSPCTFSVYISTTLTTGNRIIIYVEELGGIPDPNYFKAPALATTQSLD